MYIVIMGKVIAIYCGNSDKEEIKMIQKHFYSEGYMWNSDILKTKKHFKEKIEQYIILDEYLFECNDIVLNSLDDDVGVLRFGSPVEYLRNNKIKRIITKIKTDEKKLV